MNRVLRKPPLCPECGAAAYVIGDSSECASAFCTAKCGWDWDDVYDEKPNPPWMR